MQRITCYCLVFCGLLFAASCNTPPTGNTAEANQTPATGANATTADQSANDMSGRDYTVTTLDTTIKSPRKEMKATVDGVSITVNYGSPAVNGRTIYGDLVPYGKVWRTGANEATRITFGQPVKVGTEGTTLEAGTYSLFTLPASKDDWTIIFNKTADQWGAYDYAEGDDVARIKGTAKSSGAAAERMDFAVSGNEIQLMWSDLTISFPVAAAAK
ncbi:DUF2911 domain-containing protein [Lewinella sp. JB7]|uniref:DUF2911 domain-containing protein n=1 Tax=Lewinella sp. JB7 TaxID=2962887 RepID=UPI0020C95040|nr:DUF2911 domain-containing protein [Lewinella sp. JB7]MCP9235726.1 DUF2911 domain-containing protein [Lewinella sp. JB7]